MLIQKSFRKLATPEIAEINQRFFKTKKGEYGYGDIFLGIRLPAIRKFSQENENVSAVEIRKLIKSQFHEERMLGLIFLVNNYSRSKTANEKERCFEEYVKHFKFINNWDLVDVSCPYIVGKHLIDKDRSVLYKWAVSEDLWTKRIAIVSNWWFIRKGDLNDVFKISKILLKDEHDLIHKAVGWMLREAGKKDPLRTEAFMKQYYPKMPRTMLRYAIEHFPEAKRQKYLKGQIH